MPVAGNAGEGNRGGRSPGGGRLRLRRVAAILTNPEAASIKFLLIGLFPSVTATDMPAAIPALLVAFLPPRFAVFGFPCASGLSTRTLLFAAHFAGLQLTIHHKEVAQ
jgi:hypothetical protein